VPAPSTTREYHHGNLRQAILSTSLKLIEKKGIEALTLREIGRLAGVSRTAAYRHFADKDALLGAISEVGFVEFGSALEQARDAAGPKFEARMKAMAEAYLRFASQRPAHYRVMFQWAAQLGHEQTAPTESWQHPANHSFDVLAGVITEGQSQGKVRAGDPANLARVVWATVHGLALLPTNCDDKGLLSLCTEILLQGLRPTAETGLTV